MTTKQIQAMFERKTYTSDLTDAEWAQIEPLLPDDKTVGRPREVDLREILMQFTTVLIMG